MAEPLREAPFRRQFGAQASSVLGDNVALIAVAFAVLELTGSATDLGLVLAAQTAPLVVFLLVGGVWADRLSRQRIMIAADLVRVVTQGTFAGLLFAGAAQLWHLIVLQAVYGTATAFFRPAATGLTPQTVSPPLLQQANALLSLALSTNAVLGPAVAGALIAATSPAWALAVDSLTFLASAAFLVGLRLPPAEPRPRRAFFSELADGWREVRTRTWVWASILNFMLFQLLVLTTFQVLGPLIAKESLDGAASWAWIMGAAGVGSVLGDVLALNFEPRRPLRAAFMTGLLFVPVVILLAARAPTAAIAVVAVGWGIAWTFPNTLWFTTLQEHIPRDAISRVSSFDWLGSSVLRPIGYAIVGPVAAVLGVGPTLYGAAIVFAAVQLVALATPSIANLERRAPRPGPAPTAVDTA